ncbi:hypothetical protein SEA_DEVERA_100 [Mycobacterium phage Devera]|nr:hypothetical protein SEA_DEVERA_100 [Mycobacterium phage Devera]
MGPFPFQALTRVARPPIPAPRSTSTPAAVIPTLALCAPRRNPLQLPRLGWSPREHRRSAALQRSPRSGGGHLLHERKRHA